MMDGIKEIIRYKCKYRFTYSMKNDVYAYFVWYYCADILDF